MHQKRTWRGPRLRWVAFSLAFGAAGALAFTQWGPDELAAHGASAASVAQTRARGPETRSLASVAETAIQSVVSVSTLARSGRSEPTSSRGPVDDPRFRQFGVPERQARGLGSGVIVAKDGTVLTNSHVVENATEIVVTLPDGRECEAEVRGTDPKSDLAVLKLRGNFGTLKPIEIGDSKRLRLGDVVLAIGNPFGLGQTVTMGIVSATSRAGMGIVDYEDFIQTDAAINPGNSGGAMVNMEGQLVGINTAILSRSGGYQGIGFAIPTAMARPIMTSILEHGNVVRGWLGVAIQDIDGDLQQAFGLEERKGVLISAVTAGGPAASAGLERGDVVVEFAGQPVSGAAAFRNRIASEAPGSRQQLVVIRGGQRKQLEARLGTLPTRET